MALLEKASLADQVEKMEEEVRHNDHMRALSLENAILSERTAELEVDLVAENATRGALEKDISWILHDGVSRVVDKVIESPHFLQGLVHVWVACVAAGVE